MIGILVLAFPLASVWVLLSNHLTLDSFLVGYAFAVIIVTITSAGTLNIHAAKLPAQLFALVVYLVIMTRDIFLSGIDVAGKVLDPRKLNPGIIVIDTQHHDSLYAALSAHNITITPGQLVVEFDEANRMYVHCLDVSACEDNMAVVQGKRLHLFKRIIGDA